MGLGSSVQSAVKWNCDRKTEEEPFAGKGLFYSWRIPTNVKDRYEIKKDKTHFRIVMQEWGALMSHWRRVVAVNPNDDKNVFLIAECQTYTIVQTKNTHT